MPGHYPVKSGPGEASPEFPSDASHAVKSIKHVPAHHNTQARTPTHRIHVYLTAREGLWCDTSGWKRYQRDTFPSVHDPVPQPVGKREVTAVLHPANAPDADTHLAGMSKLKGGLKEHHLESVTLCRSESCYRVKQGINSNANSPQYLHSSSGKIL